MNEKNNERIKALRDLINQPREATYYDLKMNNRERGVLLRAAGLPDDLFHRSRKFNNWNESAKRKIKEAARKVSEWAKGLQVA